MAGTIDAIVSQLQQSADLKVRMQDQAGKLQEIARSIESGLRTGKKVILFGNGGSAADAQHLAAEFTGRFLVDRPSLPAIALTTNSSTLTAIANDYAYAQVFSRQVEAWAQPGDVVIGISTSGKSPNVIAGLQTARNKNAITVGFCGCDGQAMRAVTDFCVEVPSTDTPRIQEVHITIGHIICGLVEESLFGKGSAAAGPVE